MTSEEIQAGYLKRMAQRRKTAKNALKKGFGQPLLFTNSKAAFLGDNDCRTPGVVKLSHPKRLAYQKFNQVIGLYLGERK